MDPLQSLLAPLENSINIPNSGLSTLSNFYLIYFKNNLNYLIIRLMKVKFYETGRLAPKYVNLILFFKKI